MDDSLRRKEGREGKRSRSIPSSEARSPMSDKLTSDLVEHSVTGGRVMRGGERR